MATTTGLAGGTAPSRLVVVAGSGRSGTSSVAGVLKLLGLHVPQPEVPGTVSNPLGHFEPQWAVDFQQRLLREAGVKLSDARPRAFRLAGRAGLRPAAQQELQRWLRDQLAVSPEVVVKDPRSSWLLPMWKQAARDVGVTPCFLTMLRHPAEVVGSKNTYYYQREAASRRRVGETSRIASWVNVALFTEYPTRGSARAFMRYTDLLQDWRSAVSDAAEALDLSLRHGFKPDLAEEVDAFVDPDLRRVRVTWNDLEVPVALKDLAEEVWQQLNRLADNAGHDRAAERALNAARREYRRMYEDAYALASSSVDARVRAAVRRSSRQAKANASVGATVRRAAGRGRRLAGRARRRLRGQGHGHAG